MPDTFSKDWDLRRVIRTLNRLFEGGTPGQALVKGSASDMDFAWSAGTGIDSTGAADGDVLTADGAGGTAFEAPSGGTSRIVAYFLS